MSSQDRHEYLEEDVDWEVVPIPNKGLGVRTKKLIPAGMKIIIEPVFSSPNDHPVIGDLVAGPGPVAFSQLDLKFTRNLFLGENMGRQLTIALSIAQVIHSCKPNAAAIYDETARVAILFAQKDIQPGETISICLYSSPFFKLDASNLYSPFFKLDSSNKIVPDMNPEWSLEEELNFVKNIVLLITRGITCSADCPCHDPATRTLIQEGKQLHATVSTLARQYNLEEALAVGDKLVDVHRRLNVSWTYRAYVHFLLFQIGIGRSEMIPKGQGNGKHSICS